MPEGSDIPKGIDSQAVAADRQAAFLPSTERKRYQLLSDEGTDLQGKFLISNEAYLYNTFTPLSEHAIRGAGLYVGLDRGLDAMVNVPQLTEMYVVDYDRTTSLTTLALLEVAQRHIEAHGQFADINQFLDYFAEGNVDRTMQLLSGSFNAHDTSVIRRAFTRSFRQHDKMNEEVDADAPMIHTYLSNKHAQHACRSWVSDVDALNNIASAYNSGRIHVANANLGGSTEQSSMAQIGRVMQERRLPLSVIDISNVLSAGQTEEVLHGIHVNFGVIDAPVKYPVNLPIRPETLSVYSDSLIPRSTNRTTVFSSPALRYSAGAGMGFGYFIQNVRDWRQQVTNFGEDTWAVNTRIGQQRQGINQGITTSSTGISLAIGR